MKEQILFELNNRLTAMGISTQMGQGTDISIVTDFADASWGTGKKTIHYEAFIYANEQEQIVYMYEKTAEQGQGLSFGGDSESSFQSGATLFRKVKSIQYGPDGKAYEYDIDLGAIPKTVKEVAKSKGWKFKTVLGKHKVMNQSGMSQSVVNQPEEEAEYRHPTEKSEHSQPENRGLFGMIAMVILGMLMIGILALLGATLICWGVSLVIYGIAFFLQRIWKNKSIIIHIILCLVTAVILLVTIAMFTGGTIRISSASLEDAHMTSAMDSKGKPVDRVKSYLPNGTEFIATAELHNAPHYTKIRFVWIYKTENMQIAEFRMDSKEADEDVYVYSNLTNDQNWPVGEYKVEIYIGDREKPDKTVEFKVSE